MRYCNILIEPDKGKAYKQAAKANKKRKKKSESSYKRESNK